MCESIQNIGSALFACILCTVSIAQTKTPPPINRTPQTITCAAIQPHSALSTLVLTATSNSGLPVNLYPTTPTVCTIAGSTLTLHAAGTCVIRANQAGNQVVAPAPMVIQSLVVVSTSTPNLFDIAKPGNILQQAYPPSPSQFSFSCPRPTIVSVSPYTWPAGGTYQVTIKGTGFTSPENATESCPVPWFTAHTGADSATLLNTTVLNSTTVVGTVTSTETGPGGAAFIQIWYPPPPGDDGPTTSPGAKR